MYIIGRALDCSDQRKRNNTVSRKVVTILTVAKCKPEFLNVNSSFLLSSLSQEIGVIISDDDQPILVDWCNHEY